MAGSIYGPVLKKHEAFTVLLGQERCSTSGNRFAIFAPDTGLSSQHVETCCLRTFARPANQTPVHHSRIVELAV